PPAGGGPPDETGSAPPPPPPAPPPAGPAARRPGAVRAGPALLVGLVACGTCGRQLLVEYKTAHHYACAALSKEYGAPMCVYLDGPSLDAAGGDAVFAARAPAP